MVSRGLFSSLKMMEERELGPKRGYLGGMGGNGIDQGEIGAPRLGEKCMAMNPCGLLGGLVSSLIVV